MKKSLLKTKRTVAPEGYEETEQNRETDDALEQSPSDLSRKVSVKNEGSDDLNETRQAPEAAQDVFQPEGELAIDVYQTDSDIVIQSAIAGVRPEELDVTIENDMVTIRGIRKNPTEDEQKQYFHDECFWGPFSRQIVLPEEGDTKNAEASMKDGIFTLRIPKAEQEKVKKIRVQKGAV